MSASFGTTKAVLERSHCLCLKNLQNIDRCTKNTKFYWLFADLDGFRLVNHNT